jgi:hypothetical protein
MRLRTLVLEALTIDFMKCPSPMTIARDTATVNVFSTPALPDITILARLHRVE